MQKGKFYNVICGSLNLAYFVKWKKKSFFCYLCDVSVSGIFKCYRESIAHQQVCVAKLVPTREVYPFILMSIPGQEKRV